jgi:hypothetical protein
MTEDGHEEPVRILRVDGDLRDLLAFSQAQVLPRPPPVGGPVDSVPGGEVRALQAFAAADIDDEGTGGGHGDGADAAGRLVVEERRPAAPVVVRPPDAT